MINKYIRAELKSTDVQIFYKRFIYFFAYSVFLIFVYKYTLLRWEITVIFMSLNIIVLKKLFWEGCKDLYHYYQRYFICICLVSSLGIILMKLIHDHTIDLPIFYNRDEQEFLMVLMLFYFPLLRLGRDLNRRKKSLQMIWKAWKFHTKH